MKTNKNVWPFAIIGTFILFISGTLTLVVLACSHKQDLVSPDYYEQEVKFQTHLDRTERAQHTVRLCSIDYDSGSRCISVSLFPRPGAHVSGHVQLYRPAAAGLDQNFNLVPDSSGAQLFDASKLLPGLWKVRVFWIVDHEEFFLEKNIIVVSKVAGPLPMTKVNKS